MKKNYIVPCATIRVPRLHLCMLDGSKELRTTPESINGGTSWTGGDHAMNYSGSGDGSDINSARDRGFGSDSPWESLW